MLDALRIEQYSKVHFLDAALHIFRTGNCNQGQFSNLVGYELSIILAEKLKKEGYTNIRFEVGIGVTSVDVDAELDGEKHAFECKASKHLNNKCIKQIKGYRGYYKNVHVFICADTTVDYEILKAIKENKADIIRADMTKNDIIERVMKLKNSIN